jgi:hypothetical protein
MWFLMKCMAGLPPFCGWFISFYFGEMILTWIVVVPDHPEWAIPAAYILQIPAAMFALRKATKSVEKWERRFWR